MRIGMDMRMGDIADGGREQTSIDADGDLELPADVLDAAGLEAGAHVELVATDDGEIELRGEQ